MFCLHDYVGNIVLFKFQAFTYQLLAVIFFELFVK